MKIISTFNWFMLLVATSSLLSCGDALSWLKPQPVRDAVVYFDGDENRAIPHNYLVAFKTPSRQDFRNFATHRGMYLNFANYLTERYFTQHGVVSLDLLTAVDLAVDVEGDKGWLEQFRFPLALQRGLGLAGHAKESTVGLITEVQFEDEESAKALLGLWEERGDIWFADPNYINDLNYAPIKEIMDKESDSRYWLQKINIKAAYQELASKHQNIPLQPIVAVLDSGVDAENPALAQRMFRNQRVGLSGCRDDVFGCNATAGRKDILGDGRAGPNNLQTDGTCPNSGNDCDKGCCHGTNVAGIIAGAPQGEVLGVCPMCQIISVRVVNGPKGTIADTSIVRGLIYVTRFQTDAGQAIRVVNASFGKFDASRAVGAMIRVLRSTGNGILVVAAAGNEDTMLRAYPAAFPDVIAVSNIGNGGDKSRSSNFGPWVDIAAPGENIMSPVPNSSPEPKSGTSMSAPIVSGVAAMILSANPTISFSQLRSRILNTANATQLYNESDINLQGYYPKLAGSSTRVPLLGRGYVDALAAVKGDESGPIASFDALRRVDDGCGSLLSKHDRHTWLLMLVLMLPVLVVMLRRRQNFKETARHTIL